MDDLSGQQFVVVADPAALDAVARRRFAGRRPIDDPVRAGAGTVYVAHVVDTAGAERAILAALAGADLVVACTATDEVVDALLDDLQRLGTLREDGGDPAVLSDDQVDLLRLLAEGHSLGAAAAAGHLSRRTADRRLAAARAALGVRTTPEALVAARRLGLLEPSRPD